MTNLYNNVQQSNKYKSLTGSMYKHSSVDVYVTAEEIVI